MCAAASWIKAHAAYAGETDLFYEQSYLERQKQDFIAKNGNLKIREIRTDQPGGSDMVLRQAGVREGDRLSNFNPYQCVD